MKLHMIGNAHLDPVWLWQWDEGYHEAKATFQSALDRMNEYPDFVFTCSAAAYYEWIEDDAPEMFAQIRRRVAEGRWKIAGGWWVQPDCNAPCGESFARQGLVAQRYFLSRFGQCAKVGYNVDSFGHNAMLPQILRLSGMRAYTFMRPDKNEKNLPSNIFLWQSPDGSRVRAFRIPIAYCTNREDVARRARECAREMPEGARAAMGFYGVGNHGGGPTKAQIENILQNRAEMNMEFSSPDRFFDELSEDGLPVVEGELLHHASGCYSAHSGIKKWNRTAENALLTAEKWCAVAARILRRAYPAQALARAWKRVLFNQFHDLLSGTSIAEAYEDARDQYGEALSIARDASARAMQALSWQINIPYEADAYPIVAMNPHAFDVRAHVELQSRVANPAYALFDDAGRPVPFQNRQGSSAVNESSTLAFEAELPALGYRLFTYRKTQKTQAQARGEEGFCLENARIRAEFNPETGLLTSLSHKESGEALAGASLQAVVLRDMSDTWSHRVLRFNEKIGQFRLTRMRRVESGPVCASIRAEFAWEESRIIMTYVLWREDDQLEVTAEIDWRGGEKALKLEFFASGDTAESTAEIPFGFASRPTDGIEYPMQSWVRLGSLTVINDAKFAYDALGNRLRPTLLRSPRYAHHTPKVCREPERYPFMDQGPQTARFALCPRPLSPLEASRRGMQMNQRPFALFETFHRGPLAESGSYARVDGALLTALKLAEDGSGDLIAHLCEADGRRADVRAHLLGREIRLTLCPLEIAALRIPEGGAAYRVNLLEDALMPEDARG